MRFIIKALKYLIDTHDILCTIHCLLENPRADKEYLKEKYLDTCQSTLGTSVVPTRGTSNTPKDRDDNGW